MYLVEQSLFFDILWLTNRDLTISFSKPIPGWISTRYGPSWDRGHQWHAGGDGAELFSLRSMILEKKNENRPTNPTLYSDFEPSPSVLFPAQKSWQTHMSCLKPFSAILSDFSTVFAFHGLANWDFANADRTRMWRSTSTLQWPCKPVSASCNPAMESFLQQAHRKASQASQVCS